MRVSNYRIFLFYIFFFCGIIQLSAQTTGKIVGNVKDITTSEPIIGANVYIDNMPLGAATDSDGDFFIINVPPGEYTLVVDVIGYEKYSITGIRVSANRTATVEVEIKPALIEGETIVVTADKVSMNKDRTSSIKNVSDKQIQALPVENISEVVNMQAGVVGGHFRGGRLNEVSYLIDGLQVDEVFRGERTTIDLEKEVVSDLEVITGTFNAEYGKAMSGIVNVVTKDGSNRFHGSANVNHGNYLTPNDDKYIGTDPVDFAVKQDYKFQLEGPVIADHLFFIANARYVKDDGYLHGIRRFNVNDYSNGSPDFVEENLLGTNENLKEGEIPWITELNGKKYYSEHTGDGKFVPLENSTNLSLFGKLTFRPAAAFKLALLYSYSDKEQTPDYSHNYKYNPDGLAREYLTSHLASLSFNHLVSNSMFYDLKFSYNADDYGNYKYENPLDSRYVSSGYSTNFGGFSSGGMDKTHTLRFADQYIGKLDVTWQINKHHSIKTGLQFTQYVIENKPTILRDSLLAENIIASNFFNPVTNKVEFIDTQEIVPLEDIDMDRYKREPFDISWYIQDKMEFDDLVINYGIRMDYFDPQTYYPSNRQNPANQDERPEVRSDSIKADAQYQFSPRIGLSYTLGNSAVLHFSYGHFFQTPPFYSLYDNARWLIPTGNFQTTHGNPQVEAQKTVKYEMGLWQELAPGLSYEVSVYYSDVYDLLSAVVWTTTNRTQYGLYENKDYANTKGLEIIIDWFKAPFNLNFNYTLQFTRGNADNPLSTFNSLAEKDDPIPVLIPLEWDQRHTFTMNVGYAADNYGISTTTFYNSGFPYTIESLGESRLAKQNILPNNAIKPSNYRIDVQGHYDMKLTENTKLRYFFYIKNLFDRLNENDVYGQTGRAYTQIVDDVARQSFLSDYNSINDQYRNPGMFNAPREIKLGIGFIF